MEPRLSETLKLPALEPLREESWLDELGVDPEDEREVSEPLAAELRLPESLLCDPLLEPLDPSDRFSELPDRLPDFDDSGDPLPLFDAEERDDSEDPRLPTDDAEFEEDDEELDDGSLTDENDLLEPKLGIGVRPPDESFVGLELRPGAVGESMPQETLADAR